VLFLLLGVLKMADTSTQPATEASEKIESASPRSWYGWLFILPLLALGGILIVFSLGLGRDASLLPSTLIGKPVPEFSLPAVKGRKLGLSNTDLVGEVSLVSVFASWCPACKLEHPLFMQLKASGLVPIYGINYKDAPDDVAEWLAELGDPYTRIGADINGRVGIEWGVYGVPETFIINKQGRVVYKLIGALTPRILKETFIPMIKRLQKEDSALAVGVSNKKKESL
jgi:cytochrome c biogenesis protein CcmG, thiol:disulfide interchange protein DsbE